MNASVCVFFLFFGAIQVVTSQQNRPVIDPSIPESCYGPPVKVNFQQCCPLPPMHSLAELKACGIDPRRQVPLEARSQDQCDKKHCLLRNRGLLHDNNTIKKEEFEAFLETWSRNLTHIEEGVRMAKAVCVHGAEPPQEPFLMKRPDFCAPDAVYECVPINVVWHCKITEAFETCRALKAHMDECRQYLFKNPHQ